MRRYAASLLLGSLFFITSLSCTTDEELLFEPRVADFEINFPEKVYGRCPTLSEDARVLAWIQVDTTYQHIVVWERPAAANTLRSSISPIEWIDLSEDGKQLVALTNLLGTRSLHFWPDRTARRGEWVHRANRNGRRRGDADGAGRLSDDGAS